MVTQYSWHSDSENFEVGDFYDGGIIISADHASGNGVMMAVADLVGYYNYPQALDAVFRCTYSGHSDWRLPAGGISGTPSEMWTMYAYVYNRGEGNFDPLHDYWSSTPGYGPHVYRAQRFDGSGTANLWMDGVRCRVRPVRDFTFTPTAPPPNPGGRHLLGNGERPNKNDFDSTVNTEHFSINFREEDGVRNDQVNEIGRLMDDIYLHYSRLYGRAPSVPGIIMTKVYLWDFGTEAKAGTASIGGEVDLNLRIFNPEKKWSTHI